MPEEEINRQKEERAKEDHPKKEARAPQEEVRVRTPAKLPIPSFRAATAAWAPALVDNPATIKASRAAKSLIPKVWQWARRPGV